MDYLNDSGQEHIETLKDQTRRGGPTDDRPPRVDENPKSAADKPCMPCGCKLNGRNLIVCIDGTSNQFGKKNTNVIELYCLILKKADDKQRTWYNSGIGTYAQPSWKSLNFYKKVLYHKIDLAIAWDFERTVLGAYRWLSDNYKEGDCIFLFGFSRGAFQVRVLSAMIDKVGLVYKGNEMQIPFAYELYADPKSDLPESPAKSDRLKGFFIKNVKSQDPDSGAKPPTMAEHFKKTFSNESAKVHFVGAWDTVSSIGIARGKYMLPRTIDGMKHVCYFRHALALDERRIKFLPEYAYGGSTKPAQSKDKTKGMLAASKRSLSNILSTEGNDVVNDPQVITGSKGTLPQMKEVWFAGTHSDIGGGNVYNAGMDRSRPPLRWMVFEAAAAGLRTAPFDRELSNEEQINIIESLTWPWLFFEICPFNRLTFTRKEQGLQKMTRKPHLGSGRKIHEGQKIHSSLVRADPSTAEGYTPKARPVDDKSLFWETLRQKGITADSEWLELDLYEHSGNAVEKLVSEGDDTALKALYHTAISGDARQAVYSKVIEALNKGNLTPAVKHQLLGTSMEVLKKSVLANPDLKLSRPAQIRLALSDLLNDSNKDHQKTAWDFWAQFTDCCKVLHIQAASLSVAFSPDGRCIVSGSGDPTVRIWDAETGKPVGEPLRGHSDWVNSVAFSPDGTCIVSGSDDQTVRIWDAETGKLVGEPLREHSARVWSVAFSLDGTRIASGSGDETVRIWDAETGKLVGEPLRGHGGVVSSVTFSPDGTRIASGSGDQTVRIWDVETGKPVGEPLRGHSDWVRSVAFSPDGTRIVSGSWDQTVWVWDAETGKPVGEPLQGHSGSVRSVTYSPDGTRIASGSSDQTVQIWDAETRKPVGEPLRGHRYPVWSVAFSPDGIRSIRYTWNKTNSELETDGRKFEDRGGYLQ